MIISPRQSRLVSRRALLGTGLAAGGALAAGPLLSACAPATEGSPGGGAGTNKLTLGTTKIMQFDPFLTNTDIHIHAFYTYLVDYPTDGTYEPVPAGAEKWEFAADHGSVTVTLREATFHSGAPVTAADVVAGVKRALNPDTAFTMAQPSAFIASAKAVDDRTVKIDFKAPSPEALVIDWMFAFPLIPADKNTPLLLEHEPAGSGAFRLGEYRRDQRLTLIKNAEYYDAGKPYLDEVEYRFFTDEDALIAALESGSVDGAAYIGFRHSERLKDRYALVQGSGRMSLFFMNATIAPFDNKLLRQALARAIDRERIIKQVNFGIGMPSTRPSCRPRRRSTRRISTRTGSTWTPRGSCWSSPAAARKAVAGVTSGSARRWRRCRSSRRT